MANYNGRMPRTYAEAESMLNGRAQKKIAGNTTVRRVDGNIHVRYHATDIARFMPNGLMLFTTGGYATATTHARLNAMVPSNVAFCTRKGLGVVRIDDVEYADARAVVGDTDGDWVVARDWSDR